MKNKILSAVFLLTVLAMFFVAGSLEQGYITCGQAVIAMVVDFAAMGVSGCMSGMLTLPDSYKHKK
ncbi:MAG: hypothetical protein NC253_11120 [Ruminococcus sp.]|nr:hypothetical protein [Ruminococcus sp.]MCM1380302.1 hypothetical protein [Muribaculaceae bacterium]MCM1478282.1 hypothetical protein [Muribaculaceae bacterium]